MGHVINRDVVLWQLSTSSSHFTSTPSDEPSHVSIIVLSILLETYFKADKSLLWPSHEVMIQVAVELTA